MTPDSAVQLDLGFVSNPDILRILTDYYKQGIQAYESESFLGAIVAYGAVAEGLLTWALLQDQERALACTKAQKDPKTQKVDPLDRWGLANLINVSTELELLGATANKASWALKDFRNFIHPYNVCKQSARPDLALALSAQSALAEICRSLRGRLGQ